MSTEKSSIPRRRFTAVALGSLFVSPGLEAAGRSLTSGPESESERFAACVGDEFVVGSSVFVLERVNIHATYPTDHRPSGVRAEGFSLLFRPVSGERLINDTHPVKHPALGEFPIYLNETRIGSAAETVRYEAVFN